MCGADGILIGTIADWLHLMAVVIWFGGIVFNVVVLGPAGGRVLAPPDMGKLMGAVAGRLRVIVYACIAVVWVTGLYMMMTGGAEDCARVAEGEVKTCACFGAIMGIKHVLSLLMTAGAIYMFEFLIPGIGRAAAGRSPRLAGLRKRQMVVGMSGLIMAALILLLTAFMGAC